VRRDASTSHNDAGRYASAEPFAKAQRALGVHATMLNARRSPPVRVVVPANYDTRVAGLRRGIRLRLPECHRLAD